MACELALSVANQHLRWVGIRPIGPLCGKWRGLRRWTAGVGERLWDETRLHPAGYTSALPAYTKSMLCGNGCCHHGGLSLLRKAALQILRSMQSISADPDNPEHPSGIAETYSQSSRSPLAKSHSTHAMSAGLHAPMAMVYVDLRHLARGVKAKRGHFGRQGAP